jgi:hypothetical protein
MADYLLDCNHLSAAIRKISPVRDRIHQAEEPAIASSPLTPSIAS